MKATVRIYMIMIGFLSFAGAHAQAQLEVTVKSIREPKGTIRIGLFTNKKDFLKKAAFGKIVKASGGEVTVVLENLPPGDYAVSVIHDENENGELDSNLVGIPKEGFAFGNNAMGSFGPPSFEEAKVTLTATSREKQVITLKYF